jgi:23S rRNA (cytosine1962-C5)-methyltransferase
VQKVHLKRTKRILSGHLWVFSNEIEENLKNYEPGSLVEIHDLKATFLGIGYINPNSLISVRILSRQKREIDASFIARRLSDAIALRSRLFAESGCLRLVYSEGDYLPGLIVDRYGDCLVLQFLTLGMDRLRDMVVGILDELLCPRTIVLRNDSRMRVLEGLPLYKEIVKGTLDVLPVVKEEGLSYEVDPYEGQKTGFFLDQKANRMELRKLLDGGRALDLFCYSGAWALNMAAAGAEVIGVDGSERAVMQAKINASMNGLEERTEFQKDDVFAFLEGEIAKGEKRYDCIVLDPPAFVKSSAKLKEAVRAYRQLNEICMRLARPGGLLATSSCSYHLNREMFVEMLQTSSRNAERGVRMIGLRSQDKDHPVLLAMPETEYLKCAFLIVD